jgi:2-dehydropantoate 2-reductase
MRPAMASHPLFIVGAGAVGLHLAARLSTVAQVTVLARGARVSALARDGFELGGAEQGHYRVPVRDIRSPVPADADVLLAVKAIQLAGTLPELRLHPGQALGLCPGGLGVAALTRTNLPRARLVRISPWLGVALAAPLIVRVGALASLELSADDPAAIPLRDRWQDILRAAGYATHTVDDGITASEWRTSLWNLAVAGVCAVLGERNGAVLDSPPLHAVARAVLDEARAVASAEGVELADADIERVFTTIEPLRDARSPMLQDIIRGVATDMPYFNAEVARRAGARGLTALVNAVVARLVEHCERRARDETRQPPT